MGGQGLKQLLKQSDAFTLTLLVLPTKKDKQAIAPYENHPNVNIVWGDLTNYEDVLKGVTGADYVLHCGGMVSPLADYHPELTMKVNVGGIRNIIKAIKAQPDPDAIKLVYIGTIAQTGDRNPPIHWGRIGDPIKISIYDNYAISKTIAEREVIESGLKQWVSLRQTGILHAGLQKQMDPIIYHQPFNGVFEWISAEDSGRLLANVCQPDIPDDFWRRIYNIGGGEKYRTVNWEFMQMSFKGSGIKDFKKVFEPNWFATRNFHGQWYEDSDVLESYLHFRTGSIGEYLQKMAKAAPPQRKLAKFVPAFVMKHAVFKPIAQKPFGTLYWFEQDDQDHITAFFGTREKWEAIASWSDVTFDRPSEQPMRLEHGYDESKPTAERALEDMVISAEFRGGSCLSETMTTGDMHTKLSWRCAFGHTFEASPMLVLMGGHWCPQCLPTPWNYDEEAKRNPFFAQVWTPLHDESESNFYHTSI